MFFHKWFQRISLRTLLELQLFLRLKWDLDFGRAVLELVRSIAVILHCASLTLSRQHAYSRLLSRYNIPISNPATFLSLVSAVKFLDKRIALY